MGFSFSFQLSSPTAGVAVAHVHSNSAVISKYTEHLSEHFNQAGNELRVSLPDRSGRPRRNLTIRKWGGLVTQLCTG